MINGPGNSGNIYISAMDSAPDTAGDLHYFGLNSGIGYTLDCVSFF